MNSQITLLETPIGAARIEALEDGSGERLLIPSYKRFESDNKETLEQLFCREAILRSLHTAYCQKHFDEMQDMANWTIELAGYIGHEEALPYFFKYDVKMLARRLMQERAKHWL